MAKISKLKGIAESTVNQAGKGQPILREKAESIAAAAQIDFDKLFTVQEHKAPLSNTSIIDYHRFIHIVLAQADSQYAERIADAIFRSDRPTERPVFQG